MLNGQEGFITFLMSAAIDVDAIFCLVSRMCEAQDKAAPQIVGVV